MAKIFISLLKKNYVFRINSKNKLKTLLYKIKFSPIINFSHSKILILDLNVAYLTLNKIYLLSN